MNFFILSDPMKPAQYAMFSHIGTWSEGDLCEKCGQSSERLVEPLRIKWDPGTETIGDFSWCGYACVVRDEVRNFLEENDFKCTFGSVEVVQESKSVSKRPRPPYPRLSWLLPTKRVRLNEKKSGVALEEMCSICGQRLNRFKREGLVVDGFEFDDASLFLMAQFNSNAMFISEPALAKLLAQGFNNLCPKLAGKIVN